MRIELSKPVALNALYGTNKWGSKYIKKEGRRWQEVVSLFSHRTPFGG